MKTASGQQPRKGGKNEKTGQEDSLQKPRDQEGSEQRAGSHEIWVWGSALRGLSEPPQMGVMSLIFTCSFVARGLWARSKSWQEDFGPSKVLSSSNLPRVRGSMES